MAMYKRMKFGHYLKLYIKINSKWVNYLNVESDFLEFLEGNMGSKLFDVSLSNIILDQSPQARATKAKINKWNTSN